jgi:hypothetical protein
MKRVCCFVILAVGCTLAVGCGHNESPKTSRNSSEFRLSKEPVGAISVSELKTSSAREVAVAGRIGGESNPWVDGMAAFMLADETVLERCRAECSDKSCNCQSKELNQATVLVKFVDSTGEPLPVDSRQLLNVSELDRVVVKGTAQRDSEGNVTIVAGGIFVRR